MRTLLSRYETKVPIHFSEDRLSVMPAGKWFSALFILVQVGSSDGQTSTHRTLDATNTDGSSKVDREREAGLDQNRRVRGTIELSDGAPAKLVEVNAACSTFHRLMAIADSKGRFSFGFETNRLLDADLTKGCALEADLEGYLSQPVTLSAVDSKAGRNLGKIILKPRSPDQHGLASTSDDLMSGRQKKDYEKALDKASQQDWKGATTLLREIVNANPTYSSAWLNLGICQQIEGHLTEAEASYLEAARVDPKFARPFIRAAALEALGGNMQASLTHSQLAIEINKAAFPDAYSLNAIANLSLQHPDTAEQSARAGLLLDVTHQYPELEYVLGTVLCSRVDREAAKEHLLRYIDQSPNGPNIPAARSQLAQMQKANDALIRLAASADARSMGPDRLIVTDTLPASKSLLRERNLPLLTKPAAYTCLESLSPFKIDAQRQVVQSETIRVDIAVSDGREIYGPADGKQFANGTQGDLLGYSFSTTGLFSSIARALIAGDRLEIESAGQFLLKGESFSRYNFHALPGTANWAIRYGKEIGNATEEGWLLVDSNSLVLRKVFVKAVNIPTNLKLMSLSALIDYEPQTLGGRRVLLPIRAQVEVGERSGLKRVSSLSYDHCRVFTTDSAISFGGDSIATKKEEMTASTRLPIGIELVVSLNSTVSLASAAENDVLTATVSQPVLWKGVEFVARGAIVEGHVRLRRGENAVILELDRVQSRFGWVPFYAKLLSIGSTEQAHIRDLKTAAHSGLFVSNDGDIYTDDQEVPGVATIAFATQSSELSVGSQMVWRTEPLQALPKKTLIPQLGTSMGLR